jgi:cytochrome c oxidase subunit 2
MPGHINKMQFVAERPGDYFGECAEFCGASHAWMRFKIKVVPQENFDAWVKAWRTPPADGNPDTADVVDAPAAFGACLACHRINGTNATFAGQGMAALSGYLAEPIGSNEAVARSEQDNPEAIASSVVVGGPGPNLTLLGCRDTIGAGILENTPQNIETWLKHTDEVKEGVYMPNYYKQGSINDEQVTELANYLSNLKPAGGCPESGMPIGGMIPSGTPVATNEGQ